MQSLVQVARRVAGGQFARHVGQLWVSNGVGVAAALVQGVVVARVLGPNDYGVAALVLAYPALVNGFLEAGAADATLKYLSEFTERGDRLKALGSVKLGYVVDLALAAVGLTIVALTASWAGGAVVHHEGVAGLLVVSSGGIFIRSLHGTSRAVLATHRDFGTTAIVTGAESVLRAALTVVLVARGWGVSGVIWANAGTAAFEGILIAFAAARVMKRATGGYPWRGRIRDLRGRGREIGRYLVYSDASTMLELVVKQGDHVILGAITTPTEVGYYKLARSLTSVGNVVIAPVQQVLQARFARVWAGQSARTLARGLRDYALRVNLPLGLLLMSGALVAPVAVRLLAGSKYDPAVPVTQLLLLHVGVWAALAWVRPAVFAIGDLGYWFVHRLVLVLGSLAGFLLLAPTYGAVGMAATRVLVTPVMFAAGAVRVLHRARQDDPWKRSSVIEPAASDADAVVD
jgi:O-antigen/teichoic acid export membrane protein